MIIDEIKPGIEGRLAVVEGTMPAGRTFCQTLSSATDRWLESIFADAVTAAKGRYALVATGGYGRGELAPFSDLDVMLLHEGQKAVSTVAERLWYPIWDASDAAANGRRAKIKLGHSVRTVKEAKTLAGDDLDTATALLTGRHLAGDVALTAELLDSVGADWRTRRAHWLTELGRGVTMRHETAGDVAFLLEPDLKDGSGGLRDIHALRWAEAAGSLLAPQDRDTLLRAEEVLIKARVTLHRVVGRAGDVLHLQDQDAVASGAGYDSADELMADIAAAARSVMWIGDETWSRLAAAGRTRPVDRAVAVGVVVRNGEVELTPDADPSADPTLVLRVARAAATLGVHIERNTLDRLATTTTVFPEPWPVGALDDLVALLLAGKPAIPVEEALDQVGLFAKILPEWAPVRSKPQRNAYHRFTVDRHLWETTANAAAFAGRVSRPDLLVLGALLHDIGKGYPGDHTDVGVELVEKIGPRLGLADGDVAVLVAMVRHHLLLPDVATRRDLADDGTIQSVAAAVGSAEVLDLLHALTEADSIATGTSAWGSWKSELVEELVQRTHHVLGGGDVAEVTWRLFPTAEILELMGQGVTAVRATDDRVTVVAPDRPGLFSRVAGVLSLYGLDVLSAEAHSDEGAPGRPGMAANEFRLVPPKHGIKWDPIAADLERALQGQLAIEARLAERARTYRRRKMTAAVVHPPSVRIDNELSSNATVIEVRAPDKIGILHRLTKAMAELGLDIRHAKVQTLGHEVVDSFYVRTGEGTKLTDEFHTREVERAILHALA
jgi:[protein-PII] uridylyltransferase